MGSPKKKRLFKPASGPAAPSSGGFPVALSFSDDGTSERHTGFWFLCIDLYVFVQFLFTMLPMASNSMGLTFPIFDHCLCFGRVSMICLLTLLSPLVTPSLRSLRHLQAKRFCSIFFLWSCWPKRSTKMTTTSNVAGLAHTSLFLALLHASSHKNIYICLYWQPCVAIDSLTFIGMMVNHQAHKKMSQDQMVRWTYPIRHEQMIQHV